MTGKLGGKLGGEGLLWCGDKFCEEIFLRRGKLSLFQNVKLNKQPTIKM